MQKCCTPTPWHVVSGQQQRPAQSIPSDTPLLARMPVAWCLSTMISVASTSSPGPAAKASSPGGYAWSPPPAGLKGFRPCVPVPSLKINPTAVSARTTSTVLAYGPTRPGRHRPKLSPTTSVTEMHAAGAARTMHSTSTGRLRVVSILGPS